MTFSDDVVSEDICREDMHTLRYMTEHFEFPEELIHKIQECGLMVPETVKFGSAKIEICSVLDLTMCLLFMRTLQEADDFSKAVADAEAYIENIYRVAHGEPAVPMHDSPQSGQLSRGLQRKKLVFKHELRDALGISEDQYHEILQEWWLAPVTLQIPGKTIEYYVEDDYLMLRYSLTLLRQGYSLKEAIGKALDWGASNWGYNRLYPDVPRIKSRATKEKMWPSA